MNAVEAKNLSDTAKKELDLEPIFAEIKESASKGITSIYVRSNLIYDDKYRARLTQLGYKVIWVDFQRDGYWEVSW